MRLRAFGTTGEGGARVNFEMKLVGMDRAALKLAMVHPEVQQRVVTAIEQTTNDALSEARARVPVLSGELRDTLRREYSKTGLAGYVKAGFGKLARKRFKGEKRKTRALRGLKEESAELRGVYAAVVEFGSVKKPARPYLVPAVESVRNAHNTRIADAVRAGLDDVAAKP